MKFLFKIDPGDKRMVCQTSIIIGIVFVIIGSIMLITLGAAAPFGTAIALSLAIIGGASIAFSYWALRHYRKKAIQNIVSDERSVWSRYIVAAFAVIVISTILILLNINLNFALGFPLVVVSIFLVWLYVYSAKKNKKEKR